VLAHTALTEQNLIEACARTHDIEACARTHVHTHSLVSSDSSMHILEFLHVPVTPHLTHETILCVFHCSYKDTYTNSFPTYTPTTFLYSNKRTQSIAQQVHIHLPPDNRHGPHAGPDRVYGGRRRAGTNRVSGRSRPPWGEKQAIYMYVCIYLYM
jgi:hypothetical protein